MTHIDKLESWWPYYLNKPKKSKLLVKVPVDIPTKFDKPWLSTIKRTVYMPKCVSSVFHWPVKAPTENLLSHQSHTNNGSFVEGI